MCIRDSTRTAAGEHRLVGQEMGLDDFFGGLPVMMRWSGGRYLPGEPLALPQGTNLYEFTQGPFLPGATVTTATLSLKKRLQLYESPSEKRWSSDTSYGGSSVSLDDGQTPPNRSKQLKQVGEETIKRYYLHPRMLMEDLDKDGSEDLLVVRNTDAAKGLFRRSRLFTSGRVACLTWQPLGPVAKWETPKVSGHITYIAIGDSDGDGRRELIYTVLAGEKEGLDRRQSYIVTHVLDTSQ